MGLQTANEKMPDNIKQEFGGTKKSIMANLLQH